MKKKKGRNMLSETKQKEKKKGVLLRDTDRRGKMRRPYVVQDWATIYRSTGCHMARTAEALDIPRSGLIAFLRADDDLKEAFKDSELTEFDDVRSKLVKLCLIDEHFNAIKFYLESRGADLGFAVTGDSVEEVFDEQTHIVESMTTQEKAEAYEMMLEEDAQMIANARR